MSTPKSVVAGLRDSLAHRRAEKAQRRQLERELSSYVSAEDQLELRAMIQRHTSEESAEVAAILDRQLAARMSADLVPAYPGLRTVA